MNGVHTIRKNDTLNEKEEFVKHYGDGLEDMDYGVYFQYNKINEYEWSNYKPTCFIYLESGTRDTLEEYCDKFFELRKENPDLRGKRFF